MTTNSSEALTVNKGINFGFFGCFAQLFGFVFSSMFFGVGSLFLWMGAISPIYESMRAGGWQETPCTILSSKVAGNDSGRVEIRYSYEFDGVPLESDNFQLSNVNSGSRADKERLVAKYAIGTKHTCYVNPSQPSEAVIDRSFSWMSLGMGLFALPFVLIGLVGYFVTFFAGRWMRSAAETAQSEVGSPLSVGNAVLRSTASSSDFDDEDLVEQEGPVTLKTTNHRVGTFIGLLIFTLIWNGVISTFIFSEWDNIRQGDWSFEHLFFVPFVLVGLGTILGTIYTFLAMFNPVPVVVLSRQLIPLGGDANVSWKFDGRTGMIRTLKVVLQGEESARYRRGTSTYTSTELFHEEVLLETSDPMEVAQGECDVLIPTDTMHSFNGGNNQILWRIRVHGDIPLWPDVKEDYSLRIVPHE